MLSEEDAHVAYNELLRELRRMEAGALAEEIERAVGLGRVQQRERLPVQERLPATAALETGLHMLAAWVEPMFLVEAAKAVLSESSGVKVTDVRWAHDRLDVVGAEEGIDLSPLAEQAVLEMPFPGTRVDELRGRVDLLHGMITELAAAES